MTTRLVHLLGRWLERASLRSRLRLCGVPFWPWDGVATLRRRLDWAEMFGYPSERADPRWLVTLEGRVATAELRLMQALGVAR